jgi:hypothetical protein
MEPSSAIPVEEQSDDKLPELEIEPVSEAIFEEADELKPKILHMGLRKMLLLFTTQYSYWILVFFLITAGSLEVSSQNISVPNPKASAYEILPEGYILAWIAFLTMGFFLSYKIRQYGVTPKYRYAIYYLIGFTILFFLIMQIGVYLFNPSIFSEGTYNSYNYLPTLYFYLGFVNYLAYFFSAGILMFVIGYKPLFNSIYTRTPMSELRPELATL